MTDLSKCTELVNGWPIVYGPERSSGFTRYPWQAVVKEDNGVWGVYAFTDEGVWYKDNKRHQFNLKLPEPEWVYVRFEQRLTNSLIEYPPEVSTHRYQAGKPETMERIDED